MENTLAVFFNAPISIGNVNTALSPSAVLRGAVFDVRPGVRRDKPACWCVQRRLAYFSGGESHQGMSARATHRSTMLQSGRAKRHGTRACRVATHPFRAKIVYEGSANGTRD